MGSEETSSSEEFEAQHSQLFSRPKFDFSVNICGEHHAAEDVPFCLAGLCTPANISEGFIRSFIINLKENINLSFGFVALYYRDYEMIESTQRNKFEKIDETLWKWSDREVGWSRRLLHLYKELGERLHSILQDCETAAPGEEAGKPSARLYLEALYSERSRVWDEDMGVLSGHMGILHNEFLRKKDMKH